MPVVTIEYDSSKVKRNEILLLSEAIHSIVSTTTAIEDVPVYANSSQIKVKVSPIEIFIKMSAHKIKDVNKLTEEIKSKLSNWKEEQNFMHKINMTFIPMNWKIEIGI